MGLSNPGYMTFLPYETVVLETTLPKEEVIARLTREIAPKSFAFWKKSGDQAFRGSLNGNEFEITRIIGYRNSFLPLVNGHIQASENGTRIALQIRLPPSTLIALAIFIFLALASFVGSILSSESSGHLQEVLLPLFLYGMTMGGYWFEAGRAKSLLRDITDGDIV